MFYRFHCPISRVTTKVDLSTSREDCASQVAANYCQQKKQILSKSIINRFAQSSSLYHSVRCIIEDMAGKPFDEIAGTAKGCYSHLHFDWQQAIICGLKVTAELKKRDGHFFYENDFAAMVIREMDFDNMKYVMDQILDDDTIHACIPSQLILKTQISFF